MSSKRNKASATASATASAAASAAQNLVNERRLRHVYEWLDNGNNKKALQEAEKVLKKHPDFPCCKVLKGLALLRLGREEECELLIDSVLEGAPSDDSTLQAMSIAYRELQKPEKVCQAYESAVKADPANVELLTQLFLACVRVRNYKRQQQVAMQLFKMKNQMPYYFWAVVSVLLQATGDDKLATSVTLPLAERMISNVAKDNKVKQEQEIRLFMLVLELQNKYQDALNVLEGPLGKHLDSETTQLDLVENKKIEYLKKLDLWERVNLLALEMLHKSEDHWNLYLDYITSVFKLTETNNEKYSVESALKFIHSMQVKSPNNRGPFLAEIELQKRLSENESLKDSSEDRLGHLLVSYFEKFSFKPCCGLDLKMYLPTLGKDWKNKFFDQTLKFIDLNEENVPKSSLAIHQHVCWHQLRRIAGIHHEASTAELEQLCNDLCQSYLKTSGHVKNFSQTEIQSNDAYIVLACHILWQLWSTSLEDKYFLNAVVLLKSALKKSPANYHFRFLLIKFFNQVGAVNVSESIYKGLELKQIQLDTLGHIITRHIFTCGHFMTQSLLYSNTLKFFTGNNKDTNDYIISCYRTGSFDKILEFNKLHNRLAASQHFTSITIENMLADLLKEAAHHDKAIEVMTPFEIEPEKDEINWSELVDNRDFKAMQAWDPVERSVTDKLISESFETEKRYLRFRNLILRSLAASGILSGDIQKPKPVTENKVQNGTDQMSNHQPDGTLKTLIKQFDDHLTEVGSLMKIQDVFGEFKNHLNPVQGPDRSRLVVFVYYRHPDLFVELLRLVDAIHDIVTDPQVKNTEKQKVSVELCSKIEQIFESMVENVRQSVSDHSNMIFREQHMESIVAVVESASFSNFLCGVCQSLMVKSKVAGSSSVSGGKKTKKKKEINQDLADVAIAFNSLVSSFKSNLEKLTEVGENLRKLITNDKMTITTEKCSHIQIDDSLTQNEDSLKVFSDVLESMEASYDVSSLQTSIILKKKIAYFEKLLL